MLALEVLALLDERGSIDDRVSTVSLNEMRHTIMVLAEWCVRAVLKNERMLYQLTKLGKMLFWPIIRFAYHYYSGDGRCHRSPSKLRPWAQSESADRGHHVTEEFSKQIGADAYADDAVTGMRLGKQLGTSR